MLLINLTIFSCLCYFAFFGWPYVNANDAGDRYLFLKYRKWFLPTWTGCPQANPSRFAELNKSMQSWLQLFYDLCRVASEAFPYAKPDNIYVPLLFYLFPPHVNDNVVGNKYLLLNYTIWEDAVMIITVLWSFFWSQVTIYCFLHFGCSWRALRVAMLLWKVLAACFQFHGCVSPRRFPLCHLKISYAPMSSIHTAASLPSNSIIRFVSLHLSRRGAAMPRG